MRYTSLTIPLIEACRWPHRKVAESAIIKEMFLREKLPLKVKGGSQLSLVCPKVDKTWAVSTRCASL